MLSLAFLYCRNKVGPPLPNPNFCGSSSHDASLPGRPPLHPPSRLPGRLHPLLSRNGNFYGGRGSGAPYRPPFGKGVDRRVIMGAPGPDDRYSPGRYSPRGRSRSRSPVRCGRRAPGHVSAGKLANSASWAAQASRRGSLHSFGCAASWLCPCRALSDPNYMAGLYAQYCVLN